MYVQVDRDQGWYSSASQVILFAQLPHANDGEDFSYGTGSLVVCHLYCPLLSKPGVYEQAIRKVVIHHAPAALATPVQGRDESRPYEESHSMSLVSSGRKENLCFCTRGHLLQTYCHRRHRHRTHLHHRTR